MDIYERFGVRKYINSRGFVTGMGGSRMPPEAYEAMAEAGRCFVKLEELLDRAGAHIARLVGVEACCICSGAAGRRPAHRRRRRGAPAAAQPDPAARRRSQPGGLQRRQGDSRPAGDRTDTG